MMRTGCAAYSYRDLLQSGGMSLESFVDTCASLDLEGVELTSYYFPSVEREFLNHLKRHCFRKGQHILATAVGSNFTQPDEAKRREHVAMTKAWIGHSVDLGSPCLRVFAGPLPAGVTEEQAVSWAVECLLECVETAGEAGVTLALENHGGITGTARQVLRLLDAVDNPWLGVNLDLGNFHEDPYAEFATLAPRTVTSHAKVTSHFGTEVRELDYHRIAAILAAAGYQGYLSIEFEEAEDPTIGVPRLVQKLKQAIARA